MEKDKKVFRIVLAISAVLLTAIVVLNKKVLPVPDVTPAFVYKLPMLNAIINATCTALLISSFLAIKRKDIARHKQLNLTAFLLSSLFLISYVTYHWLIPAEAVFPKDNSLRPVYLFILISHIVLAAIVLPLVLMSFYYGIQDKREKHRKWVRFSFPIWLYVTTTGVIVYLMISPYYQHG